jgi:hypothetical protein
LLGLQKHQENLQRSASELQKCQESIFPPTAIFKLVRQFSPTYPPVSTFPGHGHRKSCCKETSPTLVLPVLH